MANFVANLFRIATFMILRGCVLSVSKVHIYLRRSVASVLWAVVWNVKMIYVQNLSQMRMSVPISVVCGLMKFVWHVMMDVRRVTQT